MSGNIQSQKPESEQILLCVARLTSAGVRLRLYRYHNGPDSRLNTSTVIVDQCLLFVGSAALTQGGLKQNKEHTVAVTTPATVADAIQEFELVWTTASVLTDDEVQSRINGTSYQRSQQQVMRELRDRRASRAKVF